MPSLLPVCAAIAARTRACASDRPAARAAHRPAAAGRGRRHGRPDRGGPARARARAGLARGGVPRAGRDPSERVARLERALTCCAAHGATGSSTACRSRPSRRSPAVRRCGSARWPNGRSAARAGSPTASWPPRSRRSRSPSRCAGRARSRARGPRPRRLRLLAASPDVRLAGRGRLGARPSTTGTSPGSTTTWTRRRAHAAAGRATAPCCARGRAARQHRARHAEPVAEQIDLFARRRAATCTTSHGSTGPAWTPRCSARRWPSSPRTSCPGSGDRLVALWRIPPGPRTSSRARWSAPREPSRRSTMAAAVGCSRRTRAWSPTPARWSSATCRASAFSGPRPRADARRAPRPPPPARGQRAGGDRRGVPIEAPHGLTARELDVLTLVRAG